MHRTARRVRRSAAAALVTVLVAVGLASAAPITAAEPASPAPTSSLLVRRDVKDLDAADRAAFVAAVKELKRRESPYDPGLSYYDQFVAWHVSLYRCSGIEHDIHAGHGGAFFLPW